MKILVIDATHGGLTLSEEYMRKGHEVVCADVHKTVNKETADSFNGIFTLTKDMPNLNGFDLIISPIHFSKQRLGNFGNSRVITAHQAVKEILEKELTCPVVEITGSYGKTETIMAALHILKNKCSILALTSEGIFHIDHGAMKPLTGKVSTTPANIIKAVRYCPKPVDAVIFEVSLGGTGLADLGIIKNVYDNYQIACGTLHAYDAKIAMIKNKQPTSSILVNRDDPLLCKLENVQWFSSMGKKGAVTANKVKVDSAGITFEAAFNYFRNAEGNSISEKYKVNANPRLFGRQHVENLLLASAIAVFLGAGEEEITQLNSFDGAVKKMVFEKAEAKVVNISSSISPLSIQQSLNDFTEIFPFNVPLCVGGVIKTTCGFMDVNEFANVINNFSQVHQVALFGELGNAVKPLLKNKKIVNVDSLKGNPILHLERR